jgi:hypothetical protein
VDNEIENEMGVACSPYRGRERCTHGFGGKNLRERDHWGNPGIVGCIILGWIFWKLDVWYGLDSADSG